MVWPVRLSSLICPLCLPSHLLGSPQPITVRFCSCHYIKTALNRNIRGHHITDDFLLETHTSLYGTLTSYLSDCPYYSLLLFTFSLDVLVQPFSSSHSWYHICLYSWCYFWNTFLPSPLPIPLVTSFWSLKICLRPHGLQKTSLSLGIFLYPHLQSKVTMCSSSVLWEHVNRM